MQSGLATEAAGVAAVQGASALLAGVVRELVSQPEAVQVEIEYGESEGALFVLEVAEEDMGAVLGAAGRTARSLRSVLMALGRKSGQRFTLDVQARGTS